MQSLHVHQQVGQSQENQRAQYSHTHPFAQYATKNFTHAALPIPGFKAPERHHLRNPARFDPQHADAHALVKRPVRLPLVRSSRTLGNMFDGAISHALLRKDVPNREITKSNIVL